MSQPASWSVLNSGSLYSQARRARIAAEYEYWRILRPVTELASEEDWTTVCTMLYRDTGMAKSIISRNFHALETLDKLPRLRALIRETYLLDLYHLSVIDKAITKAPVEVQQDDFTWRCLDEDLIALFTPKRPQQLLPGTRTINNTVADTIASVTAKAAPQVPSPWGAPAPETEDGPVPCEDPAATMRSLPPVDDAAKISSLFIESLDDGRMNFSLTVDEATGVLMTDAIFQAASTKGVDKATALVQQVLEPASINVNTLLYTASDVDDSPVYHPTTGILSEEAAATLADMVTRTLDMDAAQDMETGPHDMTFPQRAFIIGRDWICRWPGCNAQATHLDADHRINHEDGGPTRADNMVMLCRHHHNRKTDQQVTYLLDPVTGDVYWHFADGTYAVDLATGPLAPRQRRWVSTFAQRTATARKRAAAKAAAEEFERYQAANQPRGAPTPYDPVLVHHRAPPDEDPPPF
ncbi:HNH endonuclease signature motif containing protein [Corynebacterium sp.]|uniref:HNH endonuclease signature motif containing protein n=1 Tax=Corynebacterium sp. TaxID=1720 RepID=UPI0026E1138B|nr:HNH endonuclease signature motif containing protein [Corynebacterium sp.]MDO5511234.1 HNH endonuclease signature motif containing protein [Corynebacterium sp.]